MKKETLLELARRRKKRERACSQLGKGLAGFLIRFIDIEIELLMRRLRRLSMDEEAVVLVAEFLQKNW